VPSGVQFRAPHVCLMAIAADPDPEGGTIRTTIDEPLQEAVQWAIRGRLKNLAAKNVHNAAAVVIDNRSGEIRALVGSADFTDEAHEGQVNGVLAMRQPGSAIKPFMYTLALEHGLTPASILPDVPTALPDHHGDYVPENYDRHFHGPVRLRTALACSYNVPAVRAFQTIGKQAFLEKLRDLGCEGLNRDPEYYGYGLTLGNGEVTLLELATAYRALACGGLYQPAILTPRPGDAPGPRRVYDERAVYCITDILKDGAARRPAFGGNFNFPFQCAVKTGTTKDYKDNWTVGYTTRYTVGVWVGNFDGKQMVHVSGVSGAGPVFSDIMMFLHSPPYGTPPGDFPVPGHLVSRTICAVSGKLPSPSCPGTIGEWFIEGNVPADHCTIHRRYVVPGGSAGTRKEVYARYPSEYSAWAAEAGIPVPPPGATPELTPHRPDENSAHRLMIVSPNTGDYFRIDPVLRQEYQSILIKGFVPDSIDEVELHINADTVPFDGSGFQWKLRKGEYRLQLSGTRRGNDVVSAPVHITVE
jgi:penicillin-binding protein 1C